MPNGGATTRQSYTPWVTGAGVTEEDAALVPRLLSAMGRADRVESEDQLNYLSVLSGAGATYPALMTQVMLAPALETGLPEPVAHRAVEAVICGSAGILTGKMVALDGLLDSYMSYRGITAAGLTAAEGAGFAAAIRAALAAASEKARTMGQG